MRRREFIAGLGVAAATWPIAVHAQQTAMPLVGFLSVAPASAWQHLIVAFQQGLREFGYIEGQSVAIEYRWAEGQHDRLPTLAADLVRRQPTVIVAAGGDAPALAAKAATATIPIVFEVSTDPVKLGLVDGLNRPGRNFTGVSQLTTALIAKRIELLHELVPDATKVAVLLNPNSATTEFQLRELQAAARARTLDLLIFRASATGDIDKAFTSIVQQQARALVVGADALLFYPRRDQIVTLAAQHSIPAIYGRREYAVAGGLISYDTRLTDVFRQVGIYTGRVLKGERPADMPVQQVTKVELVINLKTAKALGLTISIPLLGRADEVIE